MQNNYNFSQLQFLIAGVNIRLDSVSKQLKVARRRLHMAIKYHKFSKLNSLRENVRFLILLRSDLKFEKQELLNQLSKQEKRSCYCVNTRRKFHLCMKHKQECIETMHEIVF